MKTALFNERLLGIIDYHVGDKLKRTPYCGGIMCRETKPKDCVVIFVHPKGRFYTVEFDFDGKIMRESYTVRSDVDPVRLY